MRYTQYSGRRKSKCSIRRRRRRRLAAAAVMLGIMGVTIFLCGKYLFIKNVTQQAKASERESLDILAAGKTVDLQVLKEQETRITAENFNYTDGWSTGVHPDKEHLISEGRKMKKTVEKTSPDANQQETDKKESNVKAESEKTENESDRKPEQTDKTLSSRIKEKEAQLEERIKSTAFIGNSRTEGLHINNKSSKADFFCYQGLMVNTAGKKNLMSLKNGKKGTVLDALKEGKYTDIFIMFGVNELGWKSTDLFCDYYVELIESIKKIQPEAVIYVQSILPVTDKTSKADKIYNNENVSKFNAMVVEAAEKADVVYLDVAAELCGKGNPLPPEAAAKDGIHLSAEYCRRWYEFLLDSMLEQKEQ